MCPRAVVDGWIAAISAIDLAVELIVVELNAEGFLDILHGTPDLNVPVVLRDRHCRKLVRVEIVRDRIEFLCRWREAGIKLVLSDPLVVIGRTLLVLRLE